MKPTQATRPKLECGATPRKDIPITRLRMITAGLMLMAAAGCAGPSEGMPGNPPGTAAERALDRAAGTNTSGAYPAQSDGRPGNPPGTAISRGVDRAVDPATGRR